MFSVYVFLCSFRINNTKNLIVNLDGNDKSICKTGKETHMYRKDFWTLWKKVRVGDLRE